MSATVSGAGDTVVTRKTDKSHALLGPSVCNASGSTFQQTRAGGRQLQTVVTALRNGIMMQEDGARGGEVIFSCPLECPILSYCQKKKKSTIVP